MVLPNPALQNASSLSARFSLLEKPRSQKSSNTSINNDNSDNDKQPCTNVRLSHQPDALLLKSTDIYNPASGLTAGTMVAKHSSTVSSDPQESLLTALLFLLVRVNPLLSEVTQPAQSPYIPLSSSFSSAVLYHMGWSVLAEVGAMNIEKALEEGKLLEVVSAARETLETSSRAPVSIAVMGVLAMACPPSSTGCRAWGTRRPRPPLGGEDHSDLHLLLVLPHSQCGAVGPAWDGGCHLQPGELSRGDAVQPHEPREACQNHPGPGKEVLHRLDQTGQGPQYKCLLGGMAPEEYSIEHPGTSPEGAGLRDTLHRDLSDIWCQGPLKNLSHTYEKMINDKATSLQEIRASQFLQDTLVIQDADDLEECLKACRSLFGADDESLQQVAQSMGTPVEEYKAIMKSQDLHTLLTDWAFPWMNCNTASYLYTILSYIPLLGDPIIHYLREVKHRRFLEIVVEDANTILKKILKDSTV
ncbi:hypothetical protein HPG69_018476 [Diceros bicornis minor]|uniref:Uncharacterized protein n=1 Tax=Diceros bicornis minor TaxID=77932 RepID=A0A7J7EQQ3_DICBM|nr:hypothetical protein HPG69_018476 [Diceros bicornis minor]